MSNYIFKISKNVSNEPDQFDSDMIAACANGLILSTT